MEPSHLFLIISLFSIIRISHATNNTITITQLIRDGESRETIISSGGNFELGFFSPGSSKNRYVGIWYKKITARTPVWVANRETPLTNKNGTLKVIHPGLLVLVNETNGTIWSTNASKPAQNPVAVLLDTGNLVLRDVDDDNPENFIWQSFDHPTDTLLPGMKLGWDYRTGKEFFLSSWKSNDDPSAGDFSYHCDPTGYPQNVLRRDGVKQYETGPWNGLTFSGLPSLRRNPIFTFGLVVTKNEVYYHYELENNSLISRFSLSQGGLAQRSTWDYQRREWKVYLVAPADNCDSYNFCGAYGSCSRSICECLDKFVPSNPEAWNRAEWSNGCVRRTSLDCESGRDGFLRYSGVKLPDTQNSWANESMSLEECRVMCMKNCSCMAYTSLNISEGESGCLVWFDKLVDIKDLSADGQNIYVRMAHSELDEAGRKRKQLIVSLSVVIGILLLGLCFILCFKSRRMIYRWLNDSGRFRSVEQGSTHNNESNHKDLELPHFDLETITKATDNFSMNNKIGEGGFGPVYKGRLEDGKQIAVKRLSRSSLQGIDEFKNEVICIAKLQHRNLVRLYGCCIQREENMLIYEYMTNRSLDLILFDPVKSGILDWPKRSHIINGIARGLLYLHQDSCLRIIHRDLKASNILLDSDLNPKISDFGLARSFGGNETGAKTGRIAGTYGYMSPEYAVDGQFSLKSDVFSFGVLVLEIVSGKRNRGFSHTDHHMNLLGHAWILYKEGRSLELVDSSMERSCHLSEVLRAIHVGLLCVQQRPDDRSNMSSVVLMLGNDGIVLPPAKKPGFFTEREISDADTWFSSNTATSSGQEITITQLEAR